MEKWGSRLTWASPSCDWSSSPCCSLFSHLVMSASSWSHGPEHARPSCLPLPPGIVSNSCWLLCRHCPAIGRPPLLNLHFSLSQEADLGIKVKKKAAQYQCYELSVLKYSSHHRKYRFPLGCSNFQTCVQRNLASSKCYQES